MKIPIPPHPGIIPDSAWNEEVDKIARALPLTFEVRNRKRWRHPWNVRVSHDPDNGWTFSVNPGFVSGEDPEIRTVDNLAGARALGRLGIDTPAGDMVRARICERPRIPIPATRILGEDPEVTGEVRVSAEPVPEFFLARGVHQSTASIDLDITGSTIAEDSRPEDARPLRAFDIVLKVDRLAAKAVWTQSEGDPASVATFTVTYGRNSEANPLPYLEATSRFTPPPTPSHRDIVAGIVADPETDSLLVATVFFLGEAGGSSSDPLDESWTPYVQHRLFWNLAYEPRSLPEVGAAIQPTRIETGLVGGLGDTIGNQILSFSNDAMAQAAAVFRSRTLEGHFFTA